MLQFFDLYFGEANVYQEDLDSFLVIAEQIKLKGLTGRTPSELLEEEEKPKHSEPAAVMGRNLFTTSTTGRRESTTPHALGNISKELVVQHQFGTDLQALDEKVKSMMEKGHNTLPNRAGKVDVCKICGKEGQWVAIRDHIEANHLEGISLPCNICGKIFRSRLQLRKHRCVNDAQK